MPEDEGSDVPEASEQGLSRDAEDGPRDEAEPAWMKLLAPFRSEDAAFRVLIAVVVICALIAVLALLLRAI